MDAVGRANPAARSDLLRLLALYTYGGLYTDVDNVYDPRIDTEPRAMGKMKPLLEGNLHAPSSGGLVVNNSILYVAKSGNTDVFDFLNAGVRKRASLSQMPTKVPPIETDALRKQIISETMRRRGLPLQSADRDVDLRGFDRIDGTMRTTGPGLLREIGGGRVSSIPTEYSRSELPGGILAKDGQHAAWAVPTDGRIFEKREGELREKQRRTRSFTTPSRRP